VTPPEAPQERAEGRGGLHDEAEDPRRPARLERGRVVDTVATPKGRGDEREHLVADVRPTWRLPEVEVLLDKLLQAEMLGQGGGQEKPGIGHEAVVVKGHTEPVEGVG